MPIISVNNDDTLIDATGKVLIPEDCPCEFRDAP